VSILARAASEFRSVITTGTIWQDAQHSPYDADFGMGFHRSGTSALGLDVSYETALTFSAVYACVRLISETVSSLPVDVLQRYPIGRYERPLPKWMVRPNDELTWRDFVQQIETSLLLDGNAFLPVIRVEGTVQELYVLDPRKVTVGRDKATNDPVYIVQDRPLGGAREVIHIRGLTLPGQVRGLSPVECARQTVGLGLAAEKHGAKLFSQGTAFDTVIKAKKSLTRDEAKRLAQGFALAHQGSDKAFMPAIIDADADIAHFSMTNEESQFLQARAFQVEDVCRWFGVPPHRIALTEKATSFGAGIEQQNIAFLQDAITPQLVRLESAFNPLLQEDNPAYFVRFNVSALLRGDSAARAAFHQTMFDIGAHSPNDALALEDENPYAAGGNHYVPLNYGAVEAPVIPQEPASGGGE
jgi:HK97 family phage portal protein